MEVILSANEKGGCCKTANALLLSTCLTALGYRVLVLDLDPSGNFSQAALPAIPNTVLYDVLTFQVAPEDAVFHGPLCDIIPTKRDNSRNLTPSSVVANGFPRNVPKDRKSLSSFFATLYGQKDWEYMVKALTDVYRDHYDFIVLDSPPSDGPIITNCIYAADSILIPCEPNISSIDGLKYFITSALDTNTEAQLDGLVLSNYTEDSQPSRKCTQAIMDMAKDTGLRVYKTKIRHSAAIEAAMNESRSILEYVSRGNGASDAMNFALEFLANRGLSPKVNYPGVFKDETGAYIFRKNGDKYFCRDPKTGEVQKKVFRTDMLMNAEFMEQIGKTVFFDEYSLQSR